jgi:hypothetical protein
VFAHVIPLQVRRDESSAIAGRAPPLCSRRFEPAGARRIGLTQIQIATAPK